MILNVGPQHPATHGVLRLVLKLDGEYIVAAAVAGDMFQDLKVGHILGGTPWKMQVGDIIGVIVASFVLYFQLLVLHLGDIKAGGSG